jgi:hypothetical protein
MINTFRAVEPAPSAPRRAPAAEVTGNWGGARCLMPPKNRSDWYPMLPKPPLDPWVVSLKSGAAGAAKAGCNLVGVGLSIVLVWGFMCAMSGPLTLGGAAILIWLFRI